MWEDKKVINTMPKLNSDKNVKEIIITSTDSEDPIVFQPKHGVSIIQFRGMMSQPHPSLPGMTVNGSNGTEVTLILEAPAGLREQLAEEFNKIIKSVINT